MAVTQPSPPLPATSPEQALLVQQQLTAAQLSAKKVRRAARFAVADGWMIAIFGAFSFINGLFGDISSMATGFAMAVIAYVEFDGAARIRRLDPTGPRRLGFNQLAFAVLLILYALWSLHTVSHGGGLSKELQEYQSQLGDFNDLMQTIWYAIYGGLIFVAIFGQGGTAYYYFSREKYIHRYVQETPAWIIEMQRAGGPL